MKATISADLSDRRKPRTSLQNLVMRGTSGVKRSTCDRYRGRVGCTLLRLGAAPLPGGTGTLGDGTHFAEGETLGATTSWFGTPSGSRTHRPLPSDLGCGSQ